MEIFIDIILFFIGAFIGSFASLAIYRIPIGDNIIYKHSYCPNCNYKLKTIDLIPIFSYLMLKGKCRNCAQPVRIRYILLEILSGVIFLLFGLSLNFHFPILEWNKIIYFIIGTIYLTTLILVAGIDKEHKIIQKSVLLVGVITIAGYILYLCTLHINIYRYAIYLFVMLVLLIIDTILIKKKKQVSYVLQLLLLSIYIILFTGIKGFLVSFILTMIMLIIKILKLKVKKQKELVSIGYYLCIFSILVFIAQNYMLFMT